VVPCQWRRIIGSSSGLTSPNLNFFTNRPFSRQYAEKCVKTAVFSKKKTGPQARFTDVSY
ncbi:hypothetical protein, partial [Pantoea septica]|uniref:hypothetical protein n=1 Tax=Pantoea septica TaxID=472695 RepID=UPI0028D19296